ncbi:hypothetical protein D3C81_1285950 [compost metagenome]
MLILPTQNYVFRYTGKIDHQSNPPPDDRTLQSKINKSKPSPCISHKYNRSTVDAHGSFEILRPASVRSASNHSFAAGQAAHHLPRLDKMPDYYFPVNVRRME